MSSTPIGNNKRIAKNTILLYIRMVLLMIVNLYTSRVILRALGITDFGIYSAIGVFVSMFAIISGTLSASISRFITFELGKNNQERLSKIFSASLTILLLLGFIIFILGETFGLWFVNYKMNIPADRMDATNWVMHFSLLTFIINLISLPYNAVIIAHERMSIYAYISIFEAICKLLIAYLVLISPIDRLIFYSALICLIALLVRSTYTIYCKTYFSECKFHFNYDKQLLSQLFSFAGWNFVGASSQLFTSQGVSVLMNLFFGVSASAARGIALQVEHAVLQFVNSFTTAINPQITKSYAAGDTKYSLGLIYTGAKFSYFLLFIFTLPLILETHTVLRLWLNEVPEHTVIFIRLTLFVTLLSVLSNTMITGMLATGKIKKYQLIVGGLGLLIFPLVYLTYQQGGNVFYAYIIQFFICVIQFCFRLYLLKTMIGLSVATFFTKVLLKVIKVTAFSTALPLILLITVPEGYLRLFFLFLLSFACTCSTIYAIGLTPSERFFFKKKILLLQERIYHKQAICND